ncbi:hypothetical protein T459_16493 [Capsicum annuum]|uniref:Uncharacterized protein n=1 Tax=Capsicum annuum TaxID=4072 RepID=A0A2G2Z968_CAPAN|nr:hypothetical protein T459_16493 [Capsicum annuum]
MGALSHLTGDTRFETAALRALRKLWSMRSSLTLLETTLDVETGDWIEYSSGIGTGLSSSLSGVISVTVSSEHFCRLICHHFSPMVAGILEA